MMHGRKPVMVCAAPFWAGSTASGLVAGFRDAGWIVQEVDPDAFIGKPGSAFLGKLAARLHKTFARQDYSAKIIEQCELLRPDVFLTVKGTDISSECLQTIKSFGATTVNYYPDVAFNHANFDERTIVLYDHFVTTKSFQLPWLKQQRPGGGSHFVAHGYADAVHRPLATIGQPGYLCDISYAGNHSRYKETMLAAMCAAFPDNSILVTGPNWKNVAEGSEVARHLDSREYRGVSFADLIERSRINLAFHYGKTVNDWEDLVSTRSFEIPACGGFMLHIDNPEIREYFEVGTEIDVFASPEEMVDKVAFYLRNEGVREEMARRAYARAVPRYGYAARAGEILAALDRV